jgi:hypothetical protein
MIRKRIICGVEEPAVARVVRTLLPEAFDFGGAALSAAIRDLLSTSCFSR